MFTYLPVGVIRKFAPVIIIGAFAAIAGAIQGSFADQLLVLRGVFCREMAQCTASIAERSLAQVTFEDKPLSCVFIPFRVGRTGLRIARAVTRGHMLLQSVHRGESAGGTGGAFERPLWNASGIVSSLRLSVCDRLGEDSSGGSAMFSQQVAVAVGFSGE